MQFRADPEQLLKDFESQDKSYIIGARIKGELDSAFSMEDIKKIELDTKQHINNIKDANIILFADTDLFLIILGYQNRICLEKLYYANCR